MVCSSSPLCVIAVVCVITLTSKDIALQLYYDIQEEYVSLAEGTL